MLPFSLSLSCGKKVADIGLDPRSPCCWRSHFYRVNPHDPWGNRILPQSSPSFARFRTWPRARRPSQPEVFRSSPLLNVNPAFVVLGEAPSMPSNPSGTAPILESDSEPTILSPSRSQTGPARLTVSEAETGEAQLRPEGVQSAEAGGIDLGHLARMTLGEQQLQSEVLALFDRQAEMLLGHVRRLSPDLVAALAHTLRGSARGVGAWRVAAAAEQLELAAKDSDAAAFATGLQRLVEALAQARITIRTLVPPTDRRPPVPS